MINSLTPTQKPPIVPSTRIEWTLIVLILCIGTLLRTWQLGAIPPGLTHDEAAHGQDAIAILHGERPLYETVGYGREPLYDYVVAAAMGMTGQTTYLVLRGVSAAFGVLTLVVIYLWVRRAFGVWEALLASAWLAGSFWAISTSRQGLRSVMLPVFLGAAAYAWWRGAFDDHRQRWIQWAWFGLAGLALGASLLTYMAARVTWAIFLACPLYLLVTDRPRFRARWPGMVLTLLVAGAVAAPMFVWLVQHPEAEQRFAQLGGPLNRLLAGDLKPVFANAIQALGAFTIRGDDLWMYNVPERPWLGLAEGVLFYIGVGLALWRWRKPQYALALLWLAAGIAPSLVTGVSATTTRSVAILPVLYLFPAIAVTAAIRWRRGQLLALIAAGVVIVLSGVRTVDDYFTVWAEARDVRVAYHTTLFEVAHTLDEADEIPPGSTVAISTIYPGYFHDPYALDLMMAREDLSLRWMDGRGALVFPAAPSHLVVKALAPLDPALEPAVDPPHGHRTASYELRADDLNPGFDLYDWDAVSALAERMEQISEAPAWSGPDRALELPVTLGPVELTGYAFSGQAAAPGETITLVTYWRALEPIGPQVDAVLFAHLLDPASDPPIIAQEDRLDAPAWNWHPGELFAQVHRLTLGPDVAPGTYPLEVGGYTRALPSPSEPNPPAARWSLSVDGEVVGDRILLPAVEVAR